MKFLPVCWPPSSFPLADLSARVAVDLIGIVDLGNVFLYVLERQTLLLPIWLQPVYVFGIRQCWRVSLSVTSAWSTSKTQV